VFLCVPFLFLCSLALTQVSAAVVTVTNSSTCAASTNETTVESFQITEPCVVVGGDSFTFTCDNGAGELSVFVGQDACAVNATVNATATLTTSGTDCSTNSISYNGTAWYASATGCTAAGSSSSSTGVSSSSSSTGTGAASSLSAPALLLAVLAVLARLSL